MPPILISSCSPSRPETTMCVLPSSGQLHLTGGQKPSEEIFKAAAFEDPVSGKPNPVQCRKDLPGSIYLSSALPAEVIRPRP